LPQKTLKSLIAEHLLSLQPLSIRKLLLKDKTLGKQIGIQPDHRIEIGDRFSVPTPELFEVARRVLAQGVAEQLPSFEGGQAIVSKSEDSIFIQISEPEGESVRVLFNELGMLSPDREERIRALDRCLQKIGPTGPDFAALRLAALERDLSDREVHVLLETMWNGVAGLQARLYARLSAGKARVGDLVPDSIDYFERFCGPDPGNLTPEEYLVSVLPEHRKGLLRRNVGRGLEICLFGALRDDLCPGTWLEEVSDDDLWEELEACQPQLEPFSLLGALDIALYRQYDERFRDFAEEAIAKLTAEQFQDADGFDLYQLLPSVAQFALNRIHSIDNGVLQAPFWKRMCAWMQANQVVRMLILLGVDFAKLRSQLESNLLSAGRYANLLDLRREPMYQAGELSPLSLQREIVHRLLHLEVRHSAADRVIPHVDKIGEAAARLAERSGLPLFWAFPGPLEGHRRPEEAGSLLEENHKERLWKLSPDLLLSNLIYLSQLFHLDDETRSLFREMISKSPPDSNGLDPEERLTRLANAGAAAAAERDLALAKEIAGAILTLAPSLQEGASVSLGLQGLLIASAAFEEEGAWAEWLKEQISTLAGLLPAGKASSRLYHELQELKKVTKLDLGITCRAEALASAAAFLQ
jgi:hypothetical protein